MILNSLRLCIMNAIQKAVCKTLVMQTAFTVYCNHEVSSISLRLGRFISSCTACLADLWR